MIALYRNMKLGLKKINFIFLDGNHVVVPCYKDRTDTYDTDSATIRLILTKVNSRDEGR